MGSAGRGQGDSYLGTVLKKWFELYTDMGGSLSKGKDTGEQGKSRTRQHRFGDTNARAPTQKIKCLPSSPGGRGIHVPSIKQSLQMQRMY